MKDALYWALFLVGTFGALIAAFLLIAWFVASLFSPEPHHLSCDCPRCMEEAGARAERLKERWKREDRL